MLSSLKISDTVEICVIDKEFKNHYYKTKVENLDNDADVVYVMAPTELDGKAVIFDTEHVYQMFFRCPEGIYMWPVKFIGRTKEGTLVSCKFRATSFPIIKQRREFYRQPVSINIDYIILEDRDENCINSRLPGYSFEDLFLDEKSFDQIRIYALTQGLHYEAYTGRMLDVSGGGCAFASSTLLALHSKILIKFMFRGKRFELEGLLLDRTNLDQERTLWDFRYRVQWINTSSKTVDALVMLIFAEQKDMLS